MSGRHHSVSSVTKYEECPKAYWFNYVVRQKVPDRVVPQHWRFGTVVHKALEVAFLTMRERSMTGSLSQARTEAFEALRDSWAAEQMPTTGGELDRALGIVDATLEVLTVDSAADILGVEEKLLSTTEDGTNFIGFADLVLRIGPESLLVRDWKVTSKANSADYVLHSLQLNMYGHFLRSEHPWATHVYAEEYYPPTNVFVRVKQDPELVADALSRFEAVVESIETDTEYEPRTGEHCSWCLYSAFCPAMGAVPPEQFDF